jgi:hypothetical protein
MSTEANYEVRLDHNGELDEVFGNGYLHLERMDGNQWWIGFTLTDGRMLHFRFGANNSRASFTMLVEEDWDGGTSHRADWGVSK